MSAARVVWIMAHGDPGDLLVLHSCNGGSGSHGCINIRHLRLGTAAENMRDRMQGGNFILPPQCGRGSANGNARLTEGQVRAIRADRAAGRKRADVAREYGIDPTAVTAITKGRRWGHLR